MMVDATGESAAASLRSLAARRRLKTAGLSVALAATVRPPAVPAEPAEPAAVLKVQPAHMKGPSGPQVVMQ